MRVLGGSVRQTEKQKRSPRRAGPTQGSRKHKACISAVIHALCSVATLYVRMRDSFMQVKHNQQKVSNCQFRRSPPRFKNPGKASCNISPPLPCWPLRFERRAQAFSANSSVLRPLGWAVLFQHSPSHRPYRPAGECPLKPSPRPASSAARLIRFEIWLGLKSKMLSETVALARIELSASIV